MTKYRGLVIDQLKTLDTRKTGFYDTYKDAHDAAEKLCKKTMGERGTIEVEEEGPKMSKTRNFYSVKFRNWGADEPGTAWFDNKKDADEFYDSRDHVDPPKLHQARSKDTIARYEEYCRR